MEKAKTNARSLLRRITKSPKSSESQKSLLPGVHEPEVSRLSPTLQPPSESTSQAKIPEDDDTATRLDSASIALTKSSSLKSIDGVESATASQSEAEVSHSDLTLHAEGISYECNVLYIAEVIPKQTRISKSQSELAEAIADFKKNYENFAMHNQQFLLIDDDFQNAFMTAEAGDDIRHSAQLFGAGIGSALRTIETKNKINESKWTSRIGKFMTKLYPLARLSLSVVEAVGNVLSNLQTF